MAVMPDIELVRVDSLARDVPYAYAAVVPSGALVFTAGVCPLTADGTVAAAGDVAGQAAQAMDNLEATLASSGSGLDRVVKSTVYVASTDRADLVAAWEVVRRRMGRHDAPSTLLGVTVLGWPGQLVEVEAVATR
jgi:enamine deaminase RidA (YjgF/YER057c/UK114 family)